MWRLVLTFLMLSIALPAAAQSDILDREFCKARFLNAKERLLVEERERWEEEKEKGGIVLRFPLYEPFFLITTNADYANYFNCID